MAENLKAFFKENKVGTGVYEYAASASFKDEKGNPIKWKIRPMNGDMIDEVQDAISIEDGKTHTNTDAFLSIYADCVEYPPLRNVDLQGSYNARNAGELLGSMLDGGELVNLIKAINQISHIATPMPELIEQAKNS